MDGDKKYTSTKSESLDIYNLIKHIQISYYKIAKINPVHGVMALNFKAGNANLKYSCLELHFYF